MITKELLKAEIDNVPEENLYKLFHIMKEMELQQKEIDTKKFLEEVRAHRKKIGGYLTDEELKQMK
jgi:hypothetical protein